MARESDTLNGSELMGNVGDYPAGDSIRRRLHRGAHLVFVMQSVHSRIVSSL